MTICFETLAILKHILHTHNSLLQTESNAIECLCYGKPETAKSEVVAVTINIYQVRW